MTMSRTPRHCPRRAAEAAESPVSSKSPVQFRSTLPRRLICRWTNERSRHGLLLSSPATAPMALYPLPTALPSKGSRTPHLPHIRPRDPPASPLHRLQWPPRRAGTLAAILRRTSRPRGAPRHTARWGKSPLRHLRSVNVSIPPPGPCRPSHPPGPPTSECHKGCRRCLVPSLLGLSGFPLERAVALRAAGSRRLPPIIVCDGSLISFLPFPLHSSDPALS